MEERFTKNVPGWKPTADDYMLAFRQLNDGFWREISGNIPDYAGMILADYLDVIGVELPDYCTFMRIERPDERIEFRQNGGMIRVYYDKKGA